MTEDRLEAIRQRDASWLAKAAIWAVIGGDEAAEDRHYLLAALAAVIEERDALVNGIETEWYNGNIDESARDRLIGTRAHRSLR